MRILGHTLVVEFAKDQDNVVPLKSPKVSDRFADDPDEKEKKESQQPSIPLIDTSIAPSLG
ncbi:hypothetical protein PDJAM_G00262170 [Pangasius djambal]|nr:hypothetical protein [Pangasius djambal]